MDRSLIQRIAMSGLGAVAGLCLYALSEIVRRNLLQERMALALASFGAVFFFALLAMAGPRRLLKAAVGAAVVGAIVAALMVWTSFRFGSVEQMFYSPMPVFAAMILAAIPLPFLIAADGPGWRDYPVLFAESWGIAVRYAAAGLFTGVVWGLILLSDALFNILGLTFVKDFLTLDPVPWVVTGAILGLGLAVVTELSDLISPYLLLRLLRLLLPFVLVVMGVFLVALPIRGLSGLFGGLSVAAVLLAIVAAAVTLVSVAVDQNDEDAVPGRLMSVATRAMAASILAFALLAGWAVWLRVDQYGLTPLRIFAALAALVASGYGVIYLGAILAPKTWKARIRTGNITMALVFIGFAAAWLSVLNPQAISARSQLARFEGGKTPAARLDTRALANWGAAGERALALLREKAGQQGFEDLARRLAQSGPDLPSQDLRARLGALLPVVPDTEGAFRDSVVRDLPEWQLAGAVAACQAVLSGGQPGCLLVAADFWTDAPGQEGILFLMQEDGWMTLTGLTTDRGILRLRGASALSTNKAISKISQKTLRAILDGAFQLRPVPRNSLRVDGVDLIIGQ